MRILVFSDSHKYIEGCAQVLERLIGVDMVLHAGDHASDAAELSKMFPKIRFEYVSGNCDFSKAPSEILIEVEGKKIFLTHGHGYSVKSEQDYTTLREKGVSCGADCVVFGHTHKGFNDCSKTPILLNPGSIKYDGTYGVIEIENRVLKTAICNM